MEPMKISEILYHYALDVVSSRGLTIEDLRRGPITKAHQEAARALEGKSILASRCFLEAHLGIRKQRMSDMINYTDAH